MAVLKELILTVSTLGRCGGLDKKLDLTQFLLCKGVGVLERTDFTVSTLGRCGCLERNDLTVSTLQGCGSLERTDFNSFYFGKVWQS